MKNFKSIFTDQFIQIRMLKRISRQELLKRMNGKMSASYLTKLEKNEIPSPELLYYLTQALDLTDDRLFQAAWMQKLFHYKDKLLKKYNYQSIKGTLCK